MKGLEAIVRVAWIGDAVGVVTDTRIYTILLRVAVDRRQLVTVEFVEAGEERSGELLL